MLIEEGEHPPILRGCGRYAENSNDYLMEKKQKFKNISKINKASRER